MSQHHVTRIANVLERQFDGLLDMSDWATKPISHQKTCFLSRALAALAIKNLCGLDPETAAHSVVDGFDDNGLDAVHFDSRADILYLIQSKWTEGGKNPLDPDTARKFLAGVRDLLNARFERFNDRLRRKEADIRNALSSDRSVKIRILFLHISIHPIPAHATREIDDFIVEMNDPVQIASFKIYDQAGIYGLVTSESEPPSIKLQIPLFNWGVHDKPHLAYYGRIHISEVRKWWTEYGNKLFNRNLRLFYQSSDVNDALRRTLANVPDHFWYFNNGITLICNSVVPGLAGSPGTKLGVFTCDGVSIVNGAQTVGTIGNSEIASEALQDPSEFNSFVQLRIISLDNAPHEFSRQITRAANLQNAVGHREFAAMDPLQHRLAADFALDRRKYVYRFGEPDPRGEEGCSIIEATQALACRHSVALAVQVKREIGLIWADTEASPYQDLFNETLTAPKLWRSVCVMRAVDQALHQLKRSHYPRADMVATHLNRIILHLVFMDPAIRPMDNETLDNLSLCDQAAKRVEPYLSSVSAYLEMNHEGEYLASFAKNAGKCEELVGALLRPSKSPERWPTHQANLFDDFA